MGLEHAIHEGIDWAALALEATAAAIVLVGAVLSLGVLARTHDTRPARRSMAKATLFALDVAIAADFLKAAVAPGIEALALVGGVVAIRIILAAALAWEVRSETRRG